MLIDINSPEDLELTPTENLIKILKNNKNSARFQKKKKRKPIIHRDSDKESAFIFEELGEKAYVLVSLKKQLNTSQRQLK